MSYGSSYQQQQYGAPPPGNSYGSQQGGYGAPGGGYGGPPPLAHGYGGRGAPGGFAPPPPAPRGPPRGADPQLWTWFEAVRITGTFAHLHVAINTFSQVDTDRSGAITASELERALINGDWTPFDIDTVKLLMSIFDTDHSGTIGFNEFTGLWKYVKDWQSVFKHFDRDNSGSIDGQELYAALKQFGFDLPPQLLMLVQKKYGSNTGPAPAYGAALPAITFDRFVRACVVVKQLTECFQRLDTDRDGWIQINYEGFMHAVLSLP